MTVVKRKRARGSLHAERKAVAGRAQPTLGRCGIGK